jgi:transposase
METKQKNRKNSTNPSDISSLSMPEISDLIIKQEDEIKTLSAKVRWFEEQIKLAKHNKFAASSEKSFNLSLFDEDEEELETESSPQKETVTYTRTKPNRKNKNIDTSELEREINQIDLDESEKVCACGCLLKKFGEEIKEELVFVPAKYKVIEHVRFKYTCRNCDSVKMPPAVELPLLKSKAGAPLLAEVILNKYAYHLPFYRQSKMLTTAALALSDSTIAGWAMQAAAALSPLGDALWDQIPLVRALQADETPVKVLKPEKKAYMWLYHSYMPDKRFVIFDFSLTRAASNVNERLKNYEGILQTDGYSGYNTQRARKNIISLGCWDHARRKFTDVVKAAGNNKSGKAGKVLEKIAKLYEIERTLKGCSVDERKQIRQEQSKPKLEALESFLNKINPPPKSLLATAVAYCRNQWADLTRYVEHGEALISNAPAENLVRPFAVGRRNWLFVANEQSAKKAALLYSLIQSCELNKIDPRKYLTYVLNQVHRMRRKEVDPATLLPHTIDKSLLS